MEEPQVLLVKCPYCSNRLKLKFNTPKRPETLTCTVCKQTSPFGSFAVVNNAPAAPVKSGGCETDLLVGAAQRPAASASGVETDLFVGGVGARVASSAGSGETDLYLGGAGARVAPSAGSGETDLYLRGARSYERENEHTRMDNCPPRSTIGRLVFMTGNIPTAQLYEGCNVVGRESSTSPATIRLPRQYQRISRGHLVINVRAVADGYRHEIKLFKSEVNQTMLNSTPMSGSDVFVLNHGDIITLPDVVMRFESR